MNDKIIRFPQRDPVARLLEDRARCTKTLCAIEHRENERAVLATYAPAPGSDTDIGLRLGALGMALDPRTTHRTYCRDDLVYATDALLAPAQQMLLRGAGPDEEEAVDAN
jgi:hypothetical protein